MAVTNFVWDELSDNVLMETDENDAVIANYTTEPSQFGETISQHRNNRDHYFNYDGLGSTRNLTRQNQSVSDSYTYTAFGETVASSGSTTNPFQFNGAVGYYTNEETGDFYVRSRTYDPTMERWMSRDPLGFVDGPNIYSYVGNQPINAADPTGLICANQACLQSVSVCNCLDNPPKPDQYEYDDGKIGIRGCLRIKGTAFEDVSIGYFCDCCCLQLWVKGVFELTRNGQTVETIPHETPEGYPLDPNNFVPDSPKFGYDPIKCKVDFSDRTGIRVPKNTFIGWARQGLALHIKLTFEIRLYDICKNEESKEEPFTTELVGINNTMRGLKWIWTPEKPHCSKPVSPTNRPCPS